MVLSTDPSTALRGALSMADVQQQWEDTLAQRRPKVPLSAFGTGLQGYGQKLIELLQQGHDVRIAHAQRMKNANIAGASLVRRVERTDVGSAESLRGGEK